IPGHSATVSDYEKAMRQRNRLLDEDADPRWLDALEAQMAALAAAVHFARSDAITDLQALAATEPGTDFPSARLGLTLLFTDRPVPDSSAGLEEALRELWAASRPIDRAAGRTLAGPHRVDLEIVHAQKEMPAALGST